MAWRPYENLIDGELDNRTAGKVTGWMRFFRNGKPPFRVTFDLAGDFHEDIRGTKIRLRNPNPSDRNKNGGTYVDGIAEVQRGTAGDITAGIPLGPWTEELAEKLMAQNELSWDEVGLRGNEREERRKMFSEKYRAHIAAADLYYAYVEYPYLEWYSDNGRVVLELDPSQLEIVESAPAKNEDAGGASRGREETQRTPLALFSRAWRKISPKRTAKKAAMATSPALWSAEVSRRGSRPGGWAAQTISVPGVVGRREPQQQP